MMSPWKVKLLKSMPKSLRVSIIKKALNYYVDKYADISLSGIENIKKSKGPYIFICNHLSNADAILLNNVLSEFSPYFVAGVKLTQDPVTNFGIEAVKTIKIKPNTADKEAISTMIKSVKEGNNLLIFPEGTRSRTGGMIEAKKGIILVVRLTKATVIPIGMCGTEKILPISEDGNMGNEKWSRGKVNINIGEGILLPPREEDESKHQYEDRCSNYLMKHIAQLLPEQYRGVYK